MNRAILPGAVLLVLLAFAMGAQTQASRSLVVQVRKLEWVNEKGEIIFEVEGAPDSLVFRRKSEDKSFVMIMLDSERAVLHLEAGEGRESRSATLAAFQKEAQLQLKNKGNAGVRKYKGWPGG